MIFLVMLEWVGGKLCFFSVLSRYASFRLICSCIRLWLYSTFYRILWSIVLKAYRYDLQSLWKVVQHLMSIAIVLMFKVVKMSPIDVKKNLVETVPWNTYPYIKRGPPLSAGIDLPEVRTLPLGEDEPVISFQPWHLIASLFCDLPQTIR
jgi:hypothetical protein